MATFAGADNGSIMEISLTESSIFLCYVAVIVVTKLCLNLLQDQQGYRV